MGARPSSLHEAIRTNDTGTVRRILKQKKNPIDVNEQHEGQTLLFRAVSADSLDVGKILLEHGADAGALCLVKNKEGFEFEWTVLHEACRKGNVKILRMLLSAECDVNVTAHHQMTPLHIASWHGHTEVVQELVKAGCDVNRLDMFQESALVIPICYGHTPVVEALLCSNCKLTSRSWGNTRKVRGKYEEDFRKTLYGRHGPYSLFFLAIKYSWLHIAGLLLQHGTNPNKYQILDILKNIKSNLGKFDSEGSRLVHCLLACGYRLTEKDARRLDELRLQDDYEYYDSELVDWLRGQALEPSSLMQLCRNVVRSSARVASGHVSILSRLETLFLPRTLVDYLCVREFDYSCKAAHMAVQEDMSRDPLYFSMPRRKPQYNRHVYLRFWNTSCCFRK